MYLIDTVVLSELRKQERHPAIVQWLRGKAVDALFLSVITIGEIQRGVLRQRIRNPVFAEALSAWLDRTVDTYADRILSVDTRVARRWGQLSARRQRRSQKEATSAWSLAGMRRIMTTRALLELGAVIRRFDRPCAVSAATAAGVFRPLTAVNSLLRRHQRADRKALRCRFR